MRGCLERKNLPYDDWLRRTLWMQRARRRMDWIGNTTDSTTPRQGSGRGRRKEGRKEEEIIQGKPQKSLPPTSPVQNFQTCSEGRQTQASLRVTSKRIILSAATVRSYIHGEIISPPSSLACTYVHSHCNLPPFGREGGGGSSVRSVYSFCATLSTHARSINYAYITHTSSLRSSPFLPRKLIFFAAFSPPPFRCGPASL